MNKKEKRHSRVNSLYEKAKTGKFTWTQLKEMALKIPVSNNTANDYIDEVREMLIKSGYLKNE